MKLTARLPPFGLCLCWWVALTLAGPCPSERPAHPQGGQLTSWHLHHVHFVPLNSRHYRGLWDHLHPTYFLPDGHPSHLQAPVSVNEMPAHLYSGQPVAFIISNWTRKLPRHGHCSAYFHLMDRPFSYRPTSHWVRGLLIHIVDSSLHAIYTWAS